MSTTAIAMLLFGHYPLDGRVRREAESLIASGYRVDVICLLTNAATRTYDLLGVTVHEVAVRQKKGNVLRYCFEYGAYCLLAFLRLTRLFIRHRYGVIHVNNMPNFLVFAACIPKLFGARIILDIHDPFPELFAIKLHPGEGSFSRKLMALEERLSIAFSDHVITTSEPIRQALIRRGTPARKISIVLNSPDTHIFDPALYPDAAAVHPPDRFTLIYAGTITERYGLENTVRAVGLARKRIPGLMFRVIGDGEYLPALKVLVHELGIDDAVQFLSRRPAEQIPREYMTSDAVVWFADRNAFIDIILCTKLLECLAMGLPVITTRTPCHEYYFGNGEVTFVDSLSIPKLVEAIVDLHEHYAERKPSPADVERILRRYAWSVEQHQYLRVITGVLAGNYAAAPAEDNATTSQTQEVAP